MDANSLVETNAQQEREPVFSLASRLTGSKARATESEGTRSFGDTEFSTPQVRRPSDRTSRSTHQDLFPRLVQALQRGFDLACSGNWPAPWESGGMIYALWEWTTWSADHPGQSPIRRNSWVLRFRL